jgi:preprotein translocase subunit YajC
MSNTKPSAASTMATGIQGGDVAGSSAATLTAPESMPAAIPSAPNAAEASAVAANTTGTVASTAANPAAAHKPAGLLESMAPILLMIVAFYFLVMRPQQKREAKNRELRNSAKRGDRIITAGGIIGTIHKVMSDKEISLEIAENVRIRILKSSIADVLNGSDLGNQSGDAVADDNDDAPHSSRAKKAETISGENESSAKNNKNPAKKGTLGRRRS